VPDYEVYIPQEKDRDPEAEKEMQMGKGESLRDPWFRSDSEALQWGDPVEGGK
jgi:hypothetical protein